MRGLVTENDGALLAGAKDRGEIRVERGKRGRGEVSTCGELDLSRPTLASCGEKKSVNRGGSKWGGQGVSEGRVFLDQKKKSPQAWGEKCLDRLKVSPCDSLSR